jgi:tRNA1Val (adenine37-N6)-methyltransferase
VLSYLSGDWRIFQPQKGHRWSLDDLVTAWVARRRVRVSEPQEFIDLGTGLGSVLMLLAWTYPEARLWGVEAQAARANRARRSLCYNGAEDRTTIVDGDIREAGTTLRHLLPRSPQLVTGTPPYFDATRTRAADDTEAAACRIEMRGGLEDYLGAALELVAPEGSCVLCYPSSEADRAELAARSLGLFLQERVDVIPKVGKPSLIVVDAFARGQTEVARSSVTVRDECGNWTPEFRAIRRDFGMPDVPPAKRA